VHLVGADSMVSMYSRAYRPQNCRPRRLKGNGRAFIALYRCFAIIKWNRSLESSVPADISSRSHSFLVLFRRGKKRVSSLPERERRRRGDGVAEQPTKEGKKKRQREGERETWRSCLIIWQARGLSRDSPREIASSDSPLLPSHAFKLIARIVEADIEYYDVMCSGTDAVARSGRATALLRRD